MQLWKNLIKPNIEQVYVGWLVIFPDKSVFNTIQVHKKNSYSCYSEREGIQLVCISMRERISREQ